MSEASQAEFTLSEDQRDCLQEIANVAMGQGGDALARKVGDFVQLPIPQVRIVKRRALADSLAAFRGDVECLSAVSQTFKLDDLDGHLLLIFSDTSFFGFSEHFPKSHTDGETEEEIIMDLAEVINHTCLQGIADQLELTLGETKAKICAQHQTINDLVFNNVDEGQYLAVEINYHLESLSRFNCDLVFLVKGDNLQKVLNVVDSLLED
ncbi:MAG: hypothetical protein K6L73_05285 [Cellvibrionaceae bacterium]